MRWLLPVAALLLVAGPGPCPSGHADVAREARLRARIAEVPFAALTSSPLPVCFADHAPGAYDGTFALLDATATDDVLAARLAHLGVHARDRLRPRSVERADRTASSEARGAAVERAMIAASAPHPGATPSQISTP